MPECCPPVQSSLPENKPGVCPGCGTKGKPVATLTVKSLVKDHARVSISATYSFCRRPGCDVVYFAGQSVFNRSDLKVRVGIKETEDPVPLCYCFDYSREDIRRDCGTGNTETIPQKIRAEVKAGFCACAVKNPSGACCLGDITRAVQEIR